LTDQKADFRDTCAVILAVNTERYGTLQAPCIHFEAYKHKLKTTYNLRNTRS